MPATRTLLSWTNGQGAASTEINDFETFTAHDRDEDEPCQKGTVGCSVDHEAARRANPSLRESECATW